MNESHETAGPRWTILLRPQWVICLVIGVLALLRLVVEIIPTKIEVGPETTVLSGPLRVDGTVDYVTITDRELSKGVTPDENAVFDLLKAFGPRLTGSESLQRISERLEVERAETPGPYFVPSDQIIAENGIIPDSMEESAAWAEFFEAEQQPWTAERRPLVAEWLNRNEEPLQHILAATRKLKYYLPVIVESEEPYLHTWAWEDAVCIRDAVRLLRTAAMQEVGESCPDKAFDYAIACHRFARLVSHKANLANMAGTFEAIASKCDEAIILSTQLTVDEIRQCREELAALPEFADRIEQFDTFDRYRFLDFIQAVHQGRCSTYEDAPRAGRFDPNPALRRCNDRFDAYVAAFRINDRAARMHALGVLDRRYATPPNVTQFQSTIATIFGSPAIAGRLFADRVLAEDFSGAEWINYAVDRVNARVRLVDCAYAIAEYRAVRGEYPPSLDALLPEFIEAIPLDPFAGESLSYRRVDNQFVLYSVGENEFDDGGINVGTAQMLGIPGDDIVIGVVEKSPRD